jgi:hypothetical protein
MTLRLASLAQATLLRLASASALRATAAKSLAQGRVRFSLIAACTTGFVLGGDATVLACPLCFGAEETPMIDGAKLGVLVMLAVTLAVQGGFVGFFLYLRKRAKRIAEAELDTEWSELQRSPRTS